MWPDASRTIEALPFVSQETVFPSGRHTDTFPCQFPSCAATGSPTIPPRCEDMSPSAQSKRPNMRGTNFEETTSWLSAGDHPLEAADTKKCKSPISRTPLA